MGLGCCCYAMSCGDESRLETIGVLEDDLLGGFNGW
jgi:hypothetical protein